MGMHNQLECPVGLRAIARGMKRTCQRQMGKTLQEVSDYLSPIFAAAQQSDDDDEDEDEEAKKAELAKKEAEEAEEKAQHFRVVFTARKGEQQFGYLTVDPEQEPTDKNYVKCTEPIVLKYYPPSKHGGGKLVIHWTVNEIAGGTYDALSDESGDEDEMPKRAEVTFELSRGVPANGAVFKERAKALYAAQSLVRAAPPPNNTPFPHESSDVRLGGPRLNGDSPMGFSHGIPMMKTRGHELLA